MKTILLIHGWDYANYTKQTNKLDAWHNREKLVSKLSEKYKVYKLNLPGFCGEKEPRSKEWDLNNFAEYINKYIIKNNLKLDYILGYSFGGAVAVKYKNLYKTKTKLILISPAIIRNFENSKTFVRTPKILTFLRKIMRNFYASYIVKVPEMKYGTRFLRNTYQIIVRDNLILDLEKLNPKDILIIYGEDDSMVDPKTLYNKINRTFINRIKFIEKGSHDIANTHINEIMEIIDKY